MNGVIALIALFLAICTGALSVGAWEDRDYRRMWLHAVLCLFNLSTYLGLVA